MAGAFREQVTTPNTQPIKGQAAATKAAAMDALRGIQRVRGFCCQRIGLHCITAWVERAWLFEKHCSGQFHVVSVSGNTTGSKGQKASFLHARYSAAFFVRCVQVHPSNKSEGCSRSREDVCWHWSRWPSGQLRCSKRVSCICVLSGVHRASLGSAWWLTLGCPRADAQAQSPGLFFSHISWKLCMDTARGRGFYDP